MKEEQFNNYTFKAGNREVTVSYKNHVLERADFFNGSSTSTEENFAAHIDEMIDDCIDRLLGLQQVRRQFKQISAEQAKLVEYEKATN